MVLDHWVYVQSGSHGTRIQGRKALRRVWSVPADPEVRLVPARAAHHSQHDRAHLRVGRAPGGRGAADALLNLRRKAVLSAGGASYGAARMKRDGRTADWLIDYYAHTGR